MDSLQIAREALDRAQQRGGVSVRLLTTHDQRHQARVIFDQMWPMVAGGSNLPSDLLTGLMHAGGYMSAAYVGSQVVGATIAFVGRATSDDGEPMILLHSHMSAVTAQFQNRSVGTAMKAHQRLWALQENIPVITWTFDPLVKRNARVNILKLGAQVRGYQCNFYGRMDDDYDLNDESDRVFAWWIVDSQRANRAALGQVHPIPETSVPPEAVVVEIPQDIVALRGTDLDASLRWRQRVRAQMQAALDAGYRVTGLTDHGNYVLEKVGA